VEPWFFATTIWWTCSGRLSARLWPKSAQLDWVLQIWGSLRPGLELLLLQATALISRLRWRLKMPRAFFGSLRRLGIGFASENSTLAGLSSIPIVAIFWTVYPLLFPDFFGVGRIEDHCREGTPLILLLSTASKK
jgi:hypothetical protein